MKRVNARRGQRGATLIVALIMLLLMLIHALASFTAADTQLRNSGSQQARQEAQVAAQLAIAGVLGTSAFVASPPASPVDVDIDGDGNTDFRVAVAAACTAARAVTAITVPASTPDDAACLGAATSTGDIPCAHTTWDIQAIVTRSAAATQSGAAVTMHQGIAVMLESSEAMRTCPGLRPGSPVATTPLALTKARRKTYWYMRPGL